MDLECSLQLALVVVLGILFTIGHGHLTQSHIHAGLWDLGPLSFTEKMPQAQRSDFQARFEEQLLKARIQMMKKIAGLMFHCAGGFGLCATGKFFYSRDISSFLQVCAGWMSYAMLAVCHDIVKTAEQFQIFRLFCWSLHVALVMGAMFEKDLMMFDATEKICTIGVISTSMTVIDIQVALPFYVCQAAVLTYCRWNLIGFSQLTPYVACASIIPHMVVAVFLPVCIHNTRCNIAARLCSGDASSLTLGFRQILRGVCDGDVILDRESMTIVDDASCLSRVLKSKRNYSNTNFLDLFLDAQSRQRFSDFLALEDSSGVPRGLRVALQGARGAVSMDLFCTALPRPFASSPNHCLLVMKEDPESTAIPDASEDPVPRISPQPSVSARSRSSHSSVSELVVAYDALKEVALLVSDVTGFLDIEAVHLSFQRKSDDVSNLESEMPTLRKFIRPSEWDRIEHMFNLVANLPPAEMQQRRYFQRPTLFRVPCESRSYLCARSTSLSLADPVIVPGEPLHFWMHLTQFDDRQIQRPREQQLEGIEEE